MLLILEFSDINKTNLIEEIDFNNRLPLVNVNIEGKGCNFLLDIAVSMVISPINC